MMLGVFKKNKTNTSIIELSKGQQIIFNVPANSELKLKWICYIFQRKIYKLLKYYSHLFMRK